MKVEACALVLCDIPQAWEYPKHDVQEPFLLDNTIQDFEPARPGGDAASQAKGRSQAKRNQGFSTLKISLTRPSPVESMSLPDL
jgi:hypothetical protein